mmetsp:Transcript_95823/g.310523  ORF Transcript_95823/g.310523 Transcript_95823/m.310523 type:complete len:265 (-) Transcript_95823:1853-2647(-)
MDAHRIRIRAPRDAGGMQCSDRGATLPAQSPRQPEQQRRLRRRRAARSACEPRREAQPRGVERAGEPGRDGADELGGRRRRRLAQLRPSSRQLCRNIGHKHSARGHHVRLPELGRVRALATADRDRGAKCGEAVGGLGREVRQQGKEACEQVVSQPCIAQRLEDRTIALEFGQRPMRCRGIPVRAHSPVRTIQPSSSESIFSKLRHAQLRVRGVLEAGASNVELAFVSLGHHGEALVAIPTALQPPPPAVGPDQRRAHTRGDAA